MNKQQRYREAVKSIQINKFILNGITLLGVGTASFFCLSLLAKDLPFNLRASMAAAIGFSGGLVVVSMKASPLEDAIASMYESGSKAYDEHRKQAALSKSSDLQAIQSVHNQGIELLEELKMVGTLIESQTLLSEDDYAMKMAQELNQVQADPNGYFFLQLPVPGNSSGLPQGLQQPPEQPQIGKIIDFSERLQRKISGVSGNPELRESEDSEESNYGDSFVGANPLRIDDDSSDDPKLPAMSYSPNDPVMLI